MPVYVDTLRLDGKCHMATDDPTLDELYAMARIIGIDKRRIHKKRKHPHFDLNLSQRWNAILHGAIMVTSKELHKKCFGDTK